MKRLLLQRWPKIVLLIAVPLTLALLLVERASWRPRVLDVGDPVTHIAFSADGSRLAVTCHNGEVQVWHPSTQQRLDSWQAHLSDMRPTVAFSPDARYLLTSGDGELKLWDASNKRMLHRFIPKRWAEALTTIGCFAPDSTTLAVAHQKGEVLLWDVTTNAVRQALPPAFTSGMRNNKRPYVLSSIIWTPDGKTLITSGTAASRSTQDRLDSQLTVWRRGQGRMGRWHLHSVMRLKGTSEALLQPTRSSHTFATLERGMDSENDLALRHYRVAQRGLKRIATTDVSGAYGPTYTLTPDGQTIATTRPSPNFPDSFGAVFLMEARTSTISRDLHQRGHLPEVVVFSPDGSRLASGGEDGKVLLWRLK